MSIGLGVTHCRSSSQNLNTKISTEPDFVGASNYVRYNIWYIIFMHHQGYINKPDVFYQGNKSTTRMDINGINSCIGNFYHIDIKYFFIKYRVEKVQISVMNCPTYLILADYFTKPLQEYLFHKFSNIIIEIFSPYTLLKDITSYSIKESVETKILGKQIP